MDLQKIVTHKLFTPVSVGTVSLAAGAVAGYLLGKKRLVKTIRKQLNEDVEAIITVAETIDVNVELIEAFKESDFETNELKGVPELKLIPNDQIEFVTTNVFVDTVAGWNYETELASRNPDEPYIIHQDEFYNDEMGWDNQQSLTWYEKDKILATHDDTVIYNPYVVIGDNLLFGHGSRDEEVVFIRNEKLHSEYEVTRVAGSYHEIVTGVFEERLAAEDLRHSRAPGKFPRE